MSVDVSNERKVEYAYRHSGGDHTASYLWDPVVRILQRQGIRSVLDVGCGNGAFCARLSELGLDAAGCDPSASGISMARAAHPHLEFRQLGVEDGPDEIGVAEFDAVVALEVVEHLYAPAALLDFARVALKESGILVISTPYHGYVKNLLLAVAGRWDKHLSPNWDGGHIKFWSRATLRTLLEKGGFSELSFQGAGRMPFLWKSMIVAARGRS
jgi:2-polyprenyl-3-methyl-5-hydroxy-6-metoxy-1,4-benzoquinol methylase